MRTTIDHARKLLRAKDLQEAARLQTEFWQAQFAATMKLLGSGAFSAAKDALEG